jgi:hypothetical protein
MSHFSDKLCKNCNPFLIFYIVVLMKSVQRSPQANKLTWTQLNENCVCNGEGSQRREHGQKQ